MKILVTSDTHSLHGKMKNIPEADLFIHAGDFCNTGKLFSEITSFNTWLETIPVSKFNKLICAGNHDIYFDRTRRNSSNGLAQQARDLITNGMYLEEQAVERGGLKFYFSPWTPEFCGWGFNYPREKAEEYWNKIPYNTDVLVTHGPPYGTLDQMYPNANLPDSVIFSPGNPLGCEVLANRIKLLKNLKLHIFGHIHGSRGVVKKDGVVYINAAFLNEQYQPVSSYGFHTIGDVTVTGSTGGWFFVEI